MTSPGPLLRAALLLLAASAVAAVPSASFGQAGNRPTVLAYIDFNLNMHLSWPADADLSAAEALYARVSHNGAVIGETNVTLSPEDVLPTSLRVDGLQVTETGNQPLLVELSYTPAFNTTSEQTYTAWVISGAVSIIPPVFVILVAVVTQEVLLALFVGLFVAGTIVAQGDVLAGFLATMNNYMVNSLGDVNHAFVIMFSWFLAGLVAVVQKSGGGHGIAEVIMHRISTRRGLMMATFFLGFVIFFDDYANTLILGSTMRGISDAFFVSREKLAFIVDATTAPIASIAPISSWIGFEVGLIDEQINNLIDLGYGDELEEAGITSGYNVFLESIASRYYPIYMLMFQFALIYLRRDMGPMLTAERRAVDKKQVTSPTANVAEVELDTALEPNENVPKLWWNSAVPILFTLIIVFMSLLLTGYNACVADGLEVNAANLFGNGDAYAALLYGAFVGSILAWIMIRVQYHHKGKMYNQWRDWSKFRSVPVDDDGDCPRPILTFKESLAVWIEGIKGLTTPVLVLIMAWGIGQAVQDVSTDLFFASVLSHPGLDPRMLPTLTFLISAIISFCTGTSWGTMSIVMPLAIPSAWIASGSKDIFVMSVAGVLAGAVFGDHATAISDTTILSSLATKCDLRHHVITQLPYALLVGFFSVVLGTIPGAYGLEPWLALLIGLAVMCFLPILVAERIDHPGRRLDPFGRCVEYVRVQWLKREPAEVFIPAADEDEVDAEPYRDFWMAVGVSKPTAPEHFAEDIDDKISDADRKAAIKLDIGPQA